jgi:hypothetical protein
MGVTGHCRLRWAWQAVAVIVGQRVLDVQGASVSAHAVAHRRHHCSSRSRRHPAVHCAVATVAHRDRSAIVPHLASPLDAPPPLNTPAGCNIGLVVATSPLVAPLSQRAGWLSRRLSSRCATLSFAPAACRVISLPPPPLDAPSQCRLATHRATLLFIPPGCRVTPRRDIASQHVGWLYVASHCATLTFDPAGCCVIPRRHNRHPSRSRSHLAIHVTADENAQALSQLRGPSTLHTLAKSLKSPPQRLPEK